MSGSLGMAASPSLLRMAGGMLAAGGGVGSTNSDGSMTSPTGMLGEREVVRTTGKQAIVSFLESQTCYSVLRSSGKVVVFDTRIPIQLAFYALVEHGKLCEGGCGDTEILFILHRS
jgi:hypothetical protein